MIKVRKILVGIKTYSSLEHGISSIEVLISTSILVPILAVLSQSGKYMISNYRMVVSHNNISDIKHLIVNNFSCIETRRHTSCSNIPTAIDIYSKTGDKLIDQNGSLIGRYELKASCVSHSMGYTIGISYRKSSARSPSKWEYLSSVSFECPNHFCPKKFYASSDHMELIESEAYFDFDTGQMRCTYIYDTDDCPVDDEVFGMTTNRDREIWFDQKEHTRTVSGVPVLDCFYDLRCNNRSTVAT